MKILFKYKAIAIVLLFAVGLTACSKLKDSDYEPIQVSGLNIIHASPTTELLDVYVDNSLPTYNINFALGNQIGYLSAYSGSRMFNVTKQGSLVSLKSFQYTLKPQIGYSLFVANTLENIEFVILEDNLTRPATGKAKIRFINLSPDAGTLSLSVSGSATDLASNKAFKEASDFVAIDPGAAVSFDLKNATGGIEATLPNIKIEEDRIYTFFAKGLKANTDETKFAGDIFVHKNYSY